MREKLAAAGDGGRVSSPLLDDSDLLTEEEKRTLSRGITSGLMLGVQSSIWSSFLLLAAGLALLSLLKGGPPAQ